MKAEAELRAFQEEMERTRERIERWLKDCFSTDCPQKTLYEAMAYSLQAGGKRVRPILTVKFAEAAGGSGASALPLGCAVEMLHTYSLIHDDLPCMDDDDLRRGKPTNHVVYGEANAVLAGDALQSAAFETILSAACPAHVRAACALELARGAGADGMCAGQVLDIEGENKPLSLDELRLIHEKKTGALLEAACVIGAIAGEAAEEQIQAARCYAREIGLAFQVRDDLLDHISTTEELGKPVGSDEENHKTTYYTLLGQSGCEALIAECTRRAKAAVSAAYPDSGFLCVMADWLAGRTY